MSVPRVLYGARHTTALVHLVAPAGNEALLGLLQLAPDVAPVRFNVESDDKMPSSAAVGQLALMSRALS